MSKSMSVIYMKHAHASDGLVPGWCVEIGTIISREFTVFGPQMWHDRPLDAADDVRQVTIELLGHPVADWRRAVGIAASEHDVPTHVALEFVSDVIEQTIGDDVLLDAYASAVLASDRLSAKEKRSHWAWARLMPSKAERAAARAHLRVVK